MKQTTLSVFIDALDFFLADSGRLLQNATAPLPSLLAEQPPPKRLRLEYESRGFPPVHSCNPHTSFHLLSRKLWDAGIDGIQLSVISVHLRGCVICDD